MRPFPPKLSMTVDNLRVYLRRADRRLIGAELQTSRGITQQKNNSVRRAPLLPEWWCSAARAAELTTHVKRRRCALRSGNDSSFRLYSQCLFVCLFASSASTAVNELLHTPTLLSRTLPPSLGALSSAAEADTEPSSWISFPSRCAELCSAPMATSHTNTQANFDVLEEMRKKTRVIIKKYIF